MDDWFRSIFGVLLVAAIIALATLVRLPYVQQANLSPDASDYINIARNIARGRGLTHSIKWNFFTDAPAVHSAIGERPILYPLLLVPLCRGDHPARACQHATLAMTVAALALAAAWARRVRMNWRVVAIGSAVLAGSSGLLFSSIHAWTEPLYLVLLLGVLLVVGNDDKSLRAARAAALLTALASLTRPSALAIVAGLSVWYVHRRAFSPLVNYLVTLIILLAPWWAVVWITRGSPFYSMQGFHLVVSDVRDGMAAGYGVVFPSPLDYVLHHLPSILAKIAGQSVEYIGHLFGSLLLSIFGASVFLRIVRSGGETQTDSPQSDGPCYAIALFHFVLPALTWATFDWARFMLPSFAVLVIPAVAAMDDLVAGLAAVRARVAAWAAVLSFAAFFGVHQWTQIHQRVTGGRGQDLMLRAARVSIDRTVGAEATVACSDPFSMNYYFDRPTIMLPVPPDPARRIEVTERFLGDYRPDYLLLTDDEVPVLTPLIGKGRIERIETLQSAGLHLFQVQRRTLR